MVRSFVYLALKRVMSLVLLCLRSTDAKEVEILVLRHELRPAGCMFAGSPTNPSGAWVTKQARNLAGALEDRGRVVSHLIRDRDTKFTRPFDDVWRSIGAQVVRTPVRAPNANAFAERWVSAVRRECLDHVLIVGPRHLSETPPAPEQIGRRDVLGGLIHEYDLVA